MEIAGRTTPPIGFVRFCAARRAECDSANDKPVRARMTTERWLQLVDVNNEVNAAVAPVTDMEKYKVVEYWDYPDATGDCEDYVLEKKRRLIALGWPPSALLITVARDKKGDGHAVLTVSTGIGDFILDNLNDDVLLWQKTTNTYIKRQSFDHPYVWVSLGDHGKRRASTSGH